MYDAIFLETGKCLDTDDDEWCNNKMSEHPKPVIQKFQYFIFNCAYMCIILCGYM